MDFEEYLTYKCDEIDNAAYNLAVALLSTNPKQSGSQILEWDMALIAPIIEAAIDVLQEHGKEVCWPYYEDNGVPCTKTTCCKTKECYLAAQQYAPPKNMHQKGFST